MNTAIAPKVNYEEAARRHYQDARYLLDQKRLGNTGQLLGFAAECGMKSMLVACGAPVTAAGDVTKASRFREHLPKLIDLMDQIENLSDSRLAGEFLARIGDLDRLRDWDIHHRYWSDAELPIASVSDWQQATHDILLAIDNVTGSGANL